MTILRAIGSASVVASMTAMSIPAFAQDPAVGPSASSLATAAQPNPNSATPQSAVVDSPGDIVVTARRREENAQTVPVSISAFSAETLKQKSVQQLSDLNTITPGFRISNEGGAENASLTLRGLGQIPIGEGTPAVVTYFSEVPLPASGSNVATYDLANIQVLKGPQGTLFGRNTLGGAVLITPQAPEYSLGGYARVTYGRFDYRALEAAVNVPVIDDKVSLRLAGQIRRQDPRTQNLSGGPGFDNLHEDSFRASLLVQPTATIRSLTIVDYYRANEQQSGAYLLRQNPGVIPGLSELIDGQLSSYLAAQKAGVHKVFSPFGSEGSLQYIKAYGVTNKTTIDLGDVTLQNIFGYRRNTYADRINTGGNGPLTVTVPTGVAAPATVTLPFILFRAEDLSRRSYVTEEVQLQGRSLGDRLNWIVGAFYSHDRPASAEGSTFAAFQVGDAPSAASTSHIWNTSRAVFGQVGYKLTDQLTLNAGLRYSWDKSHSCGGSFGADYATAEQCKTIANLGLIDGIGTVRNHGSAPSWTLGLDYKVDQDLFLYATSRRGYRAANVNAPLFETIYTTGGTSPTCAGPSNACPDLRPYQTTKSETLTDGEIGAKYNWRHGDMRGRVDVAAFYEKYSNALEFFNVVGTGIFVGAPDLPSRQAIGINAADETIKGLEFTTRISPVRSLTLSFNGAYTDSHVDKLTTPPVTGLSLTKSQITLPTPKWTGTVSGSWMLPVRPLDTDLVLNGDYFFTTKFAGTAGENLPGYHLVNVRLDLNAIGGSGLDIGLFARNLFDKKYFSGVINLLRTFPTDTVYVGEPRTYGVEARVRF